MGADSKIEWCDHTFNPWIGCTKVSEGCAHCYAEKSTRARVLRSQEQETWGKGARRALTSDANWKLPVRWNREALELPWHCPSCNRWMDEQNCLRVCADGTCSDCGTVCVKRKPRVFCASLADWLDDEVPLEHLHRLLKLVFETQNVDWLLLTKRPQNWRGRILKCLILEEGGNPEDEWYFYNNDGGLLSSDFAAWLNDWTGDTPPENVWMGTTVENQARAEERIPHLLQIPAKVRFLSCEPLLGPVDLTRWLPARRRDGSCNLCGFLDSQAGHVRHCPEPQLHWVIAGGESGPGARPMHPDWARSLRDQCAGAGVPFLFKQWGNWLPSQSLDAPVYRGEHRVLGDGWHAYNVGKKAAGRRLDGREWNGFPGI